VFSFDGCYVDLVFLNSFGFGMFYSTIEFQKLEIPIVQEFVTNLFPVTDSEMNGSNPNLTNRELLK